MRLSFLLSSDEVYLHTISRTIWHSRQREPCIMVLRSLISMEILDLRDHVISALLVTRIQFYNCYVFTVLPHAVSQLI